jgi:alpha-mannosidase
VQEHYPDLYNRIQNQIASGQWEVTGGMWVEADCNIPSGESLLRQFLYGKRYFRQELGVECQVAWLPDSFGFCYSLPQIMKICGMRYFMTTKLSWNQFCKFPHDTFWWQGLDGTQVLAYFISTPDRRGWNDYSVDLNPANLKNCWDNYQQKKENAEVLLSFGWGDGGGGPTREMLENGRRLQQISVLPHFHQGKVETFFTECEQRVTNLPVWNDELYLQFHRGTYTSQAKIKKNNRTAEVLLHNAELFCSIDFLHSGPYPQKELQHAWELLLLNQFHDILPGSSIAEVYQDSELEFTKVRSIGNAVLQQACSRIAPQKLESDQSLIVFNGLGWPTANLAFFSHPFPDRSLEILTTSGNSLPYQVSKDGRQVLFACRVPALGWQSYRFKKTAQPSVFSSTLHISTQSMENRFFIINLNEQGFLTRVYDKRCGRDILADGQTANRLQIFEDRPIANDAWDIDPFYQDKLFEISDLSAIEVLEEGPLRGGISLTRRFLNSTIRQNIFIYDEIPRIDFETEIDWQQHQTLLKVAFPLAVHSPRATYEIAFGSIDRPTHWNTEWDQAKFEVPAQRWADLSEGDYGVSLLNDCKYGYDIKDHVMRLTLLKSAIEPDPQADIGLHNFCYSLYPHQGDWRNANTVRMASEFNNPLFTRFCTSREDTETALVFSFANIDCANLVIDTIKKAEDGDCLIIRIYEAFNQRGTAAIEFAEELQQVWECNGLEEKINLVECQSKSFSFQFRPFEIKTYMLAFKINARNPI